MTAKMVKWLLAVLLTVTACGPPLEATAPLSAKATAPVDVRLIGNWIAMSGKGDPDILVIDRDYGIGVPMSEPPTWLYVNLVKITSYKTHSFHLRAHPSDVDGVTYYNLRRDPGLPNMNYTADGERPGYIIVSVHFITDDLFFVCTLGEHAESSPEPMVRVLRNLGADARMVHGVPRFGGQVYEEKYHGPLQPTHGMDTEWDYVILDVTSERLVDLIKTNRPNKLFYLLTYFTRFPEAATEKHLAALKEKWKEGPPPEIEQACISE